MCSHWTSGCCAPSFSARPWVASASPGWVPVSLSPMPRMFAPERVVFTFSATVSSHTVIHRSTTSLGQHVSASSNPPSSPSSDGLQVPPSSDTLDGCVSPLLCFFHPARPVAYSATPSSPAPIPLQPPVASAPPAPQRSPKVAICSRLERRGPAVEGRGEPGSYGVRLRSDPGTSFVDDAQSALGDSSKPPSTSGGRKRARAGCEDEAAGKRGRQHFPAVTSRTEMREEHFVTRAWTRLARGGLRWRLADAVRARPDGEPARRLRWQQGR